MSWQDCIGWLDMEGGIEDWRNNPDAFQPSASIRADVATEFLKHNSTWLSDISVPIYDHQLEWVAMVFGAVEDSKVLELTADCIWNYIKRPAHDWLLDKEESSVAY